jgi:hypothetical protein
MAVLEEMEYVVKDLLVKVSNQPVKFDVGVVFVFVHSNDLAHFVVDHLETLVDKISSSKFSTSEKLCSDGLGV